MDKKNRQSFAIYDLNGRWLDHEYSEEISEAYKNAQCRFNRGIILERVTPSEILELNHDKANIDLRDTFGGERNYKLERKGWFISFFIKTETYKICIWGGRKDFLKFLDGLKDLQNIISSLEKDERSHAEFMNGFYWHGGDLDHRTR